MRQNTVLLSNCTYSFLPLPQNGMRTCLPILVENNSWSLFLAKDLKVSPDFNQSNLMYSIQTHCFLAFKACPLPQRLDFYLSSLIFRFITVSTSVRVIWMSQNPVPPGPCLLSSFGSSCDFSTWAHFLCTWPRPSYPSKSASGLAKIFFIIILPLYHP